VYYVFSFIETTYYENISRLDGQAARAYSGVLPGDIDMGADEIVAA
jgi:hypothetical protein